MAGPRGWWAVSLREYGVSAPCMTGAGAWSASPAVCWICFRWGLDSARAALCHQFNNRISRHSHRIEGVWFGAQNQVERSQMRCLRYLVRMPPRSLPDEAFRAHPTSRSPEKTQDTLEGLCLSAALGTLWDPSTRNGSSNWGEGDLGFPAALQPDLR